MKKQIQSLINIITIVALFFPVLFTANLAFALPDIDPSFDANVLISDKAFSNKNAFKSASEVQAFIKEKGSPLANTSPDFISMLREPDSSSVKTALDDPHANLDHKRNAA